MKKNKVWLVLMVIIAFMAITQTAWAYDGSPPDCPANSRESTVAACCPTDGSVCIGDDLYNGCYVSDSFVPDFGVYSCQCFIRYDWQECMNPPNPVDDLYKYDHEFTPSLLYVNQPLSLMVEVKNRNTDPSICYDVTGLDVDFKDITIIVTDDDDGSNETLCGGDRATWGPLTATPTQNGSLEVEINVEIDGSWIEIDSFNTTVSPAQCSHDCSYVGEVGCVDIDTSWTCQADANDCRYKQDSNCSTGYECSSGTCIETNPNTPPQLQSPSLISNNVLIIAATDPDGDSMDWVEFWLYDNNENFLSQIYMSPYNIPWYSVDLDYLPNGNYKYMVISYDGQAYGYYPENLIGYGQVTICHHECGPVDTGCVDTDTRWSCTQDGAGCYVKVNTDCETGIPCTNGTCQAPVAPDTPVINCPADQVTANAVYTCSWTSDYAVEIQEATDSGFSNPTGWSQMETSKSFSHDPSTRTTYYYRVRAFDNGLYSNWSNTESVVVDPCDNECSLFTTGCSADNSQSWTCGDAFDGDMCLDKVYTNCASGYECSSGNCQELPTPPTPTITCSADQVTANAVYTCSWNSIYAVQIQEATNNIFSGATGWSQAGTTKSFSHDPAIRITYYYRVRAENNGVYSNWSNTESVVVDPCDNECSLFTTGCSADNSQSWTCGEAYDGDMCLDKVYTNCALGSACSNGSCESTNNLAQFDYHFIDDNDVFWAGVSDADSDPINWVNVLVGNQTTSYVIYKMNYSSGNTSSSGIVWYYYDFSFLTRGAYYYYLTTHDGTEFSNYPVDVSQSPYFIVCDNECADNSWGCEIGNEAWTCQEDIDGCFLKAQQTCSIDSQCVLGECELKPDTPAINTASSVVNFGDDYFIGWPASQNSTGYVFEFDSDSNFTNPVSWFFGGDIIGLTLNDYPNPGITTDYYYRLRAVNDDLGTESPWSNVLQITLTYCIPAWQCTEWSYCSSGIQTRTCTDVNSCGDETDHPIEQQDCTTPCEIYSVGWSQQQAQDGDNVSFIIDNNGYCEDKPIEIWIYQDQSTLVPPDYRNTVYSTIGTNYYVNDNWLVSYHGYHFGPSYYYFIATVDNQIYTSDIMTVSSAFAQPTESIEDLFNNNPLVLSSECSDYGESHMNYNCIIMREDAHASALEGINGAEIADHVLTGLGVVWVVSGAWCIGGNLLGWAGVASCPVTLASCAGAPVFAFIISSSTTACGIFAADTGAIAMTRRNAARSFRSQTLVKYIAESKIAREAEQATILSEVVTAEGALLRTSRNNIVTQDIILFRPGASTTPIRYTFKDFIGEYAGGRQLLDYSRTKVKILDWPKVTPSEKSFLASTFETNTFQPVAENYINLASFGKFRYNDVLSTVRVLSGEARSSANSYHQEVRLGLVYDSIISSTTRTLTRTSALKSNYHHELTHLTMNELLVRRGVVLRVPPQGKDNLVTEYFTDTFARNILINDNLINHEIFVEGFLRAAQTSLNSQRNLIELEQAYIAGNKYPLLAVYNSAKGTRNNALISSFEASIQKSGIDLTSFRSESQVMRDDFYLVFNELKNDGSLSRAVHNILVKYEIIEGTIIGSSSGSSSSTGSSPFWGCALSDYQTNNNFGITMVLIILPYLIFVSIYKRNAKKSR